MLRAYACAQMVDGCAWESGKTIDEYEEELGESAGGDVVMCAGSGRVYKGCDRFVRHYIGNARTLLWFLDAMMAVCGRDPFVVGRCYAGEECVRVAEFMDTWREAFRWRAECAYVGDHEKRELLWCTYDMCMSTFRMAGIVPDGKGLVQVADD